MAQLSIDTPLNQPVWPLKAVQLPQTHQIVEFDGLFAVKRVVPAWLKLGL